MNRNQKFLVGNVKGKRTNTLEGCDVVDGAVEAADGVPAKSLGAAGQRAETAVGIGVRHLAEAMRRMGRWIHGRDAARAGAKEAAGLFLFVVLLRRKRRFGRSNLFFLPTRKQNVIITGSVHCSTLKATR